MDPRKTRSRRLTYTLLLAGGYMVAEIVGGWLTNSLALLADAGHMLSDMGALGLGLFAFWIAARPATSQKTYGYYRMEILAALVNGATLIAVSLLIFVEAYHRLWQPPEVMGGAMMTIAVGGLVINLMGLRILGSGGDESLNIRGAWLHVFTDALGSVGAIVAGVFVWTLDWNWADPAVSALIGILVIYSAWQLVAESVSVLMENAPRGVDVDAVRLALLEIPSVSSIHDLHVWTITSGLDSLSAHVVVASDAPAAVVLAQLRSMLDARFGIGHVTLQLEPEDFGECPECHAGAASPREENPPGNFHSAQAMGMDRSARNT